MRRLFTLLIYFALPLAAAADPTDLTLEEAVDTALAGAPQVTAQAEGVAALQSLADSAGRLPDPALVVGIDNLPIEGPDAWSTSADFMTMRTIGLMQEFPRRAKRRLERERAAAGVDLAQAELAQASLFVAQGAAQAWIRSATLEKTREALATLLPEVELGAASARAAVASARASTADAFAAEAAVAALHNRLLAVEGEARQARAELARWVGAEAERPLAPPPSFGSLPEPAAALLADIARHAAVLPFEARLNAARADVELARAERRPDWSAEISYAKRGPAFSDMASLQFTVGLPLFTRHRQDPVIAARGAELRRVEAEREAELRAHRAELRRLLIDWEQSGARLAQFDSELLPLARARTGASLAAYRAGVADLRVALDAFEDEIDLLVERAALADAQGRAWAYLRYLEPRHLARS